MMLLCSFIFFITSCEKADDLTTEEKTIVVKKQKFETKRVSLNDISENHILKNKIDKINENIKDEIIITDDLKKINNRIVSFSDHGFSINTDSANYIEDTENGNHSYTFNILREKSEFEYENLILSYNENNNYDVYIAQYNLAKTDLEYLGNENFNVDDDLARLTKLGDEDIVKNILSLIVGDPDQEFCTVITFVDGHKCGAGEHTKEEIMRDEKGDIDEKCVTQGQATFGDIIITFEPCSDGGGGDSGYSSENKNPISIPKIGNNNDNMPEETGGGGNSSILTSPDFGDDNEPCKGDPIPNPEIAPQSNSGINGGRYGNTRSGGTQFHGGLDLKTDFGDPIYAMFDGTATAVAKEYTSAGWITFQTATVNGENITIQYFHLQKDNRASGTIKAGDIIGYQGESGNLKEAIIDGYAESHLHIKIKDSNSQTVNPEDYLTTKFDSEGNRTNFCNN